jgi:endonuclease/exonuclease/phosphatase family metal-dependent hydrolase
MRIVTWNVLGLTGYPPEAAAADIGHPGDSRSDEHFATVFAGLEADVLALQEGVSHGIAQRIAARLERYLVTIPSPMSWPGHVLSRYPVVESLAFSHAAADGSLTPFSRVCGAARLQVAPEEDLWVVCLHLHPGDVALRAREGDLLRHHLDALLASCERAVVLGDFNCDLEEGVHTHLRELGFVNAMTVAGGGVQLTMDTAGIRPWRIDHIYLSPPLVPRLRSAAVVRDPGFRTDPPRGEGVWDHSDHLPVRVDLDGRP